MRNDSDCLICGEGTINPVSTGNLVYSVCDSCGSEQADANQINENVRIAKANKESE